MINIGLYYNDSSSNGRDNYIDSLKGVLIFFVVYGHILLVNFPYGSINCTIKNFIFLFHMPLFIFISGMFSKVKEKKYIYGLIRLLETYLVFQFIHYIIPLPYNYGVLSFFNYLVFPTWTMWYLLSLIFWRLMVLCLRHYMRGKVYIMIAISLLISLIGGFIPVNSQFSLQRTMCFLPFFIIGYYMNPSMVKLYLKRIPYTLAIAIPLLILVCLYFIVRGDLGSITAGSSNYYIENHALIAMVKRIVFFVCAFLLSISIMRMTPSNRYLSGIGKVSLFIYIMHTFIATIIFYIFNHFTFVIGSPIIILITSIAITYLLALIGKTKWKSLLNPISSFYHQMNNI